jgi:hypothetical protein
MALYVDGPSASIDDLTGYDSQLLDVSSTERIDVTRKIALAHEELGVDLAALLARTGSSIAGSTALSGLVATPALRLWHAYRTLEMVYSDAYNSQLNDRYAGKRDQFRAMARWAREKLIEAGLGISTNPVPQPASPEVSATAGALPDGTYYITMAWLNSNGEEGQCAPTAAITTSSTSFVVTPPAAPPGVTGWNLYVGWSPDDMRLQNEQALTTTESWPQPSAVMTGGPKAGQGQAAVAVRPVPRMLQRG